MKLTTYANKLAGRGTLTRDDVVSLAKAAAKDGTINKQERAELKTIRQSMADRMEPSAKGALTRLINNIPENVTAKGRAVDPDQVKNLINGDPRLAWRTGGKGGGGGGAVSAGGGGESGGSVSGGGGGGGGYVSSGGGGESGGSVSYTPAPSYVSSGGGGE
jgi:hypothetical protein